MLQRELSTCGDPSPVQEGESCLASEDLGFLQWLETRLICTNSPPASFGTLSWAAAHSQPGTQHGLWSTAGMGNTDSAPTVWVTFSV